MPRIGSQRLAVAAFVACFVASCVAIAAPRRDLRYSLPEDRLETLSVEVRQIVDTSFTRIPPEGKAYDTDDLIARIGHSETRASGTLERVVARAFRDGSYGLVTRIASLEGTTERGEGARPLELGSLVGKSVSMRVLGSGQVVDSFGWTHLSGAAGGGDLVSDALLQSTLRLPRTLPTNRPVMATWALHLPIDPFLKRIQNWTLTWSAAAPPDDCKRCIALSYTGTIKEESRDTHPARPMSLEGTASVEGTILLTRASRRLLHHSWTIRWERSVLSHRSNDDVRGSLKQTVESTGTVRAVGP